MDKQALIELGTGAIVRNIKSGKLMMLAMLSDYGIVGRSYNAETGETKGPLRHLNPESYEAV